MNRTLSCTVSEEKLIRAFAFLGRSRLNAPTLASIARMCVELVAQQLEESPSESENEQFKMLANGVGRVSGQVKLQVGSFSSTQQQSVSKTQHVPTTVWWQELGCCSAQEAEEYTQFLRDHSLTRTECSYSDWHLRKAGMSPELEAQTHEREQRERREREEMARIVEQMKKVDNEN